MLGHLAHAVTDFFFPLNLTTLSLHRLIRFPLSHLHRLSSLTRLELRDPVVLSGYQSTDPHIHHLVDHSVTPSIYHLFPWPLCPLRQLVFTHAIDTVSSLTSLLHLRTVETPYVHHPIPSVLFSLIIVNASHNTKCADCLDQIACNFTK